MSNGYSEENNNNLGTYARIKNRRKGDIMNNEKLMTLEEAIMHAEEVACSLETKDKCDKCAAEHRQLAEWLKELKELRNK